MNCVKVCNTVKHFCIIALGYALILTISLSLVVLVFGSKALIMQDLRDSGRLFLSVLSSLCLGLSALVCCWCSNLWNSFPVCCSSLIPRRV